MKKSEAEPSKRQSALARRAGAVVIAQDIDAEADYFGKPRLIVQMGQVPSLH